MYNKNIKYTRKLIKNIVIFLYLLLPLYGYSTEIVTFEEPAYTTSIYRFNLNSKHCYSVTGNKNNIIYISNDDGILVFNGTSWNLIPLPEKCFGIYAEDQKIYFVCETFIGIFSEDRPTYNGFKRILLPKKITGSSKVKLIKTESGLYFFSKPSLFMVLEDKLKPINNTCIDVSVYQKSIYIIDPKSSLYKLNGRQTEFITELGQNKKITGFISSKINLWVKTENATIFSIDPNLKTFNELPVLSSVNAKKHVQEIILFENTFLQVDSNQRISLLNLGNLKKKILQFTNPLSGAIKFIYSDCEENIWLLSDEGIIRLSLFTYASNLNFPGHSKGNWSTYLDKYLVYTNTKLVNIIYSDSLVSSFHIPGLLNHVIPVGSRFIGYDKNAVYDVSMQGKARLVEKGSISLMVPSQLNYSGFYCVIDNQLRLFYYSNNSWNQHIMLKNLPESLNWVLEIDDNHLLLLSNTGKLYKTDEKQKYKPIHLLNQDKTLIDQPWLKIIRNNENIYLQNFRSVYRYTAANDSCSELTCLQELLKSSSFIHYFKPLANNSAVITIHPIGQPKQDIYLIRDILSPGSEKFIKISPKLFDPGNIYQISAYDKNTLVLHGENKTVKFNTQGFINEPRSKHVFISKIIISPNDTAIYENRLGFTIPFSEINLKSGVKYIRFDFISPGYKSENEIKYACFFEGYDHDWSDWQAVNFKSYSRLKSGRYTFHLKALQNNGQISEETVLVINIKAPFYISSGANILYVVIIISLVIYFLIKRKKKFEKEKANLEHIINERTSELQREKEITDELLANILPKDTLRQLKNTGKASSQKYELVTVLFSDIEGFTKIAEQMNPEKLIDELDNFFFHFDSVVEKYNIEKIKTIGDAYMCAGGIPYKNRTNPVEVVLAALEMQDYMRQLRQKDINIWDLRIGIHTGAVIAGVVGHKKLSYDIWGDTVNTASRMESSGEASKINISGHTYELVKDFFVCEYRGRMPVKYKGDVDMYFVKSIRPELSVDLKVIPNKKFFIQLQLLRLHDLEEFIFERLTVELSENYFFHSTKRTKDVHTQAELIARAEEISPEEMLIVRTTALLIDSGIISNYYNHLIESVKFAREILPKFKYSIDQIDTICRLILTVDYASGSTGKLESILWDAYLNYFGRVDYLEITLNLLKEIKIKKAELNEKEWWETQVQRLRNFKFKTSTGQLLREVSAEKQIQKVMEYLNLF